MDKKMRHMVWTGRWIVKLIKWSFIATIFTVPNISLAQTEQTVREMQVKAAFLYNFTKFVYWNSSTERGAPSTITIGLIQADDMASVLDDFVIKNTSGSEVIIKRINTLNQEMTGCQIIYIDQSQKENLSDILNRVKGNQVLTVSDITGFTRKGGVIGLFQEDGKIKIEINETQARSSGLEISAKLMEVARVIK